jgi:collagenase-like PrtC family protease
MSLKKRFKIGLCDVNIGPLIEKYNDYIDSFFVGAPIVDNCRGNYILVDKFSKLIQDCKDIPVWVTANAPVINSDKLNTTLDLLIGYWLNFKFHGYITSHITVLKELSKMKIPVQVSTTCDIRDLNDVSRYREMGFKDIVLSYKVNRNLKWIEEAVKEFPDVQFCIILDELCESNCPHRYAHFVSTSLFDQQPGYECPIRYPQDTFEWKLRFLQNTLVPPENLLHYPESIKFKLPTRMIGYNIQNIMDLLSLYICEKQCTNLFELINHHAKIDGLKPLMVDKELFKSWLTCGNQCYKCNLCENELKKQLKGDS